MLMELLYRSDENFFQRLLLILFKRESPLQLLYAFSDAVVNIYLKSLIDA
jgi:hypothetical protein